LRFGELTHAAHLGDRALGNGVALQLAGVLQLQREGQLVVALGLESGQRPQPGFVHQQAKKAQGGAAPQLRQFQVRDDLGGCGGEGGGGKGVHGGGSGGAKSETPRRQGAQGLATAEMGGAV
jgi:hypothetical protein